ncbi:hypothetical protein [Stenotrophomonas maltophilia]|uniref:hypothetical protein n=1 Tax=Stenotrophomonas maltophilia TaxID=40324 RepID=UPI002090DB5B|nr:hypothetical protein [Stenotrophomonas maltophilia]MCO5735910.1 hypothetical protein [Stenotrophomonas maltophilia]
MNDVAYSIAKKGRFLFRTAEVPASHIAPGLEADLKRAFPASEGYSITKVSKPTTQYHTTIEN